MTPALAAFGLGHTFGSRAALAEVSFAVAQNSFTLLLGPNGAGKTTLVSLIAGLYAARTGSIAVFGHDIRTERSRALEQLGIVFQMPSLDPELTVTENLLYHASLHGLSRSEARERMAERLRLLGIAERAGDRVRALSGGLRRRAEIARALLHGPRLLLCDEASVGLDLEARRAILAHLRGLCRTEGLTVLWATHLLDEAEEDDPTIVLHGGRVSWSGRGGDLAGATGAASFADGFLNLTSAPA